MDHLVGAGTANPVVLTGDIHTSWAADLRAGADPSAAPVATEYVCTSITAGGTQPATYIDGATALPGIKLADPRHGGYSAATVTADRWTTDFWVVDDMENAESGLTNIGTFVTEAGRPGTDRA
jgi:alkaline phosphatase D